jgi:hypothetical protein
LIGAAAFILSNLVFWVAVTMNKPDFSWPTTTLLSLPFAFIVGQLAEGLAAAKNKVRLPVVALRGALLGLGLTVVMVTTQFFGTIYVQPADWLYVGVIGLGIVASGTALTIVGDLAPGAAIGLAAAIRMGRGAHPSAQVESASPGPIDERRPSLMAMVRPRPKLPQPAGTAENGAGAETPEPTPAAGRGRRSVWS